MKLIVKEIAIFIAQANIAVNSAGNGSLCTVLMTAYKTGWNNGFSQAKPHTTEEFIESQLGDIREKSAAAHIPFLTPELISKNLFPSPSSSAN
jgi:hypothetical protein